MAKEYSQQKKERIKKYGRGKKGRARAAAAAAKEIALKNYERVTEGNDGGSMKRADLNAYVESLKVKPSKMGASMKTNQSGGEYAAKNSSAPAKQLMRNQKDGGSMYGKKHGSSMNKYDKKMMHLREQISDDKKAIHRTDQAKKSHAHPIFKHMRKF
jgi:hypothetical protein